MKLLKWWILALMLDKDNGVLFQHIFCLFIDSTELLLYTTEMLNYGNDN